MVEVCQKLSEVQSNFVSCPDKGTKSPAFYSSFIVLHLTQSQGTIPIIVFYLHLTSILLVSNLHLTSILPDTRAPSPSLYSTFILLLSYFYLTSILLESYLILMHHPHHCIPPSSYFYLTQELSSSCNSLTLHNSYSMACETIFDLTQILIKIHLTTVLLGKALIPWAVNQL